MKKMVKNKPLKKVSKKKMRKKSRGKDKSKNKIDPKKIPTLQLKKEDDIARDFAVKVYKKFDKIIKAIVLFGSTVKQTKVAGSDIDIIIIIDDVSLRWDQELVAWYREELDKILKANPYQQDLHINTIKLSTWWQDLMRGDAVVLNILRNSHTLIDAAGFFDPLKYLLIQGKIRPTPEAIYSALQRAPMHIMRSKAAELASIEGLFWAMVDSAHAALIAANVPPASPEHISSDLKEAFVDTGKLKMKYVSWYRDLLILHKKIMHKHITDLKGVVIDEWQEKAEEFLKVMVSLVREIVEGRSN